MDETRFDRIAKSLASSASRRALGTLVSGGLVDGLAAAIAGSDGAARKKGDGERRDRDKGDKRKRRRKRHGGGCPANQENSGGVCATPPGCTGQGGPCTSGDPCCSTSCGVSGCDLSATNEPCNSDGDCFPGVPCRGFICGV